MVEQLQVAVGLKETVQRWCWSQPQHQQQHQQQPLIHTASLHPACKEELGGAPGLTFLQQLLQLKSFEAAAPIPAQLFLEESGDAQEGRVAASTDDAALIFSPYPYSSLNSSRRGLQSNAALRGGPAGALPQGPPPAGCSVQASSDTSFCCLPEAQAGVCTPQTAAAATTQHGLPRRALLSFGSPVQQEVLEGPQCASGSEEKAAAKLLESAAPSIEDAVSAAASAAAAPPEAQEQHGGPQLQLAAQVLKHPRLAAAKLNKDKGVKRRPDQQGPLQGTSRGASLVLAAAPAPGVAALQVVGGPVARAEGPPQKRQAVGRRRGETAAATRSNSSSSSSSSRGKAGGGGPPSRAASAAARGFSAGGPQYSSCRLSHSAKATSPPTQKQQRQQEQAYPQQQQQQATGGLQADKGDVVATESAAAAAAVAAARCSSSSTSGGAEAAVHAFAAEWLRGCQQRLKAFRGKGREQDNFSSSSSSVGPLGLGDASSSSAPPVAVPKPPHEDLQQIKKQLKQELRGYNTAFAAHFGRQPLKQDKEPLRPVYMHYQRIKQRLEQHLAAAESNAPPAAAAATTTAAESVSAASASLPEVSSAASSTRRSTADSNSPPAAASPTAGILKRLTRHPNARSLDALSPKASHRVGTSVGAPRSPARAKEKQTNKPIGKPTAFERQQLLQRRREEMALQLHQLQRERRLLGDKLAAYHLRFKQEHGMPLRLKADIAPVQEEYKLFVEITKQIDALAFALQKQTL